MARTSIRRRINKGALVHVASHNAPRKRYSEGGVGTVVKKKKRKRAGHRDATTPFVVMTQETADTSATGESLFDVRYTLDGRLSQEVERKRVSIHQIQTTARRRSSDDDVVRPSLLSPHHRPRQLEMTVPIETTRHTTTALVKHSHAWLIANARTKDRNGRRVLLVTLTEKNNVFDSFGWLRRLEGRLDPPEKDQKHLTEKEKRKAIELVLAACHDSAGPLVAHAWGVDRKTIFNLKNKMILSQGGISVARKVRSDKGKTVLSSQEKRRAIFTPSFVFAKLLRKENPDELFTKTAINEAWQTASKNTKAHCKEVAEEWIESGPFLVHEITRCLEQTGGVVSWSQLATSVSGSGNLEIISKTTIRKFVMSLPESSYKTTRILPKLDRANKLRRYWWALQFWIFWDSARNFNRVQILLVHMDEKWFWSIVIRRYLKSVPFLGIEPVVHGQQHKSHIGKRMVIASTCYAPKGNVIDVGGEAFLVSLTQVGKQYPAEKDTYKRVYKTDGSGRYHYPKIPENRLRKKGELYFKAMEITGSKKGTAKDPKFDLLTWFKEVEIPALEELCRPWETRTGVRAIIRYQMDGAGPHMDTNLQSFLQDEFGRHGWMLIPQPSNSPITNVKDDCLFPALSKHVSREQGLMKGGIAYNQDEIFPAVEKCWRELPKSTIARGYVRHSQIASAIAQSEGGDEFVRDGSVHCNVRKCCVTVCDDDGNPIGVEVVQSYEGNDEVHMLKYDRPYDHLSDESVNENLARMSRTELEIMFDNLPSHLPMFDCVVDALVEQERREMEDNDA